MAGENGVITLAYIASDGNMKYKTNIVGYEQGQLKPNVWYCLDESNKFIETSNC
jgi:hypothetical protein